MTLDIQNTPTAPLTLSNLAGVQITGTGCTFYRPGAPISGSPTATASINFGCGQSGNQEGFISDLAAPAATQSHCFRNNGLAGCLLIHGSNLIQAQGNDESAALSLMHHVTATLFNDHIS